jgi:PAS domain S-box-containing protein
MINRPDLGRAILATVSDAIIATDRGGVINFWNPGAARIFGFTATEAIGQSLDLIIPENLRARHWDGYDRVMATGESRYGDGELLAVPGGYQGWTAHLRRIHDHHAQGWGKSTCRNSGDSARCDDPFRRKP